MGIRWSFDEVKASIFIGLLVFAALEENLQLFLELGEIDLYRLESIGDLFEADLLIGLVGTVESLLVAVLLDDLATVSDLVEAECGRRPLQKVAEAGQFVQVLLGTGWARSSAHDRQGEFSTRAALVGWPW